MVLPNGQFRLIFFPKDFEASRNFYRDGLGLPIDHEWDYGGGDRGIVFTAGGGMVELLGMAPGSPYIEPQGVNMLIQVADVDQWLELAQQRGLDLIQPPTSFPWGHRILRLKDPDGVVVSLFSPIEQ